MHRISCHVRLNVSSVPFDGGGIDFSLARQVSRPKLHAPLLSCLTVSERGSVAVYVCELTQQGRQVVSRKTNVPAYTAEKNMHVPMFGPEDGNRWNLRNILIKLHCCRQQDAFRSLQA